MEDAEFGSTRLAIGHWRARERDPTSKKKTGLFLFLLFLHNSRAPGPPVFLSLSLSFRRASSAKTDLSSVRVHVRLRAKTKELVVVRCCWSTLLSLAERKGRKKNTFLLSLLFSKVDHLPLPVKEPAPRRRGRQRQPHGRVRPFLWRLRPPMRAHVRLDGPGAEGKGAEVVFASVFRVVFLGEGQGEGARVADLGELLRWERGRQRGLS